MNAEHLKTRILYIIASLICVTTLLLMLSGLLKPAQGRNWQALGFAALFIPFSAYFFVRARQSQVYNHRVSNGLCLHCGYDIRATPDRCPECGKISEVTTK